MKKYRYGDPTKVGILKKYGGFLYFFAAWNMLGLVAWKAMSVNKQSKDENWSKMSSTEKYMSLIGYGSESASKRKHVKMSGLSLESTSSESAEKVPHGNSE